MAFSPSPGYYYGPIGDWWFVQSIATAHGGEADAVARSWIDCLRAPSGSQDDRPVSVGLLPVTTGPFAPANIADLLDLLTIHEYPRTGHALSAVSTVDAFAAFHKPVILGESFMLSDDGPTQSAFLRAAAPRLSGAFEFFDGRDPNKMEITTVYDAVYCVSLQQFSNLRHLLLTG